MKNFFAFLFPFLISFVFNSCASTKPAPSSSYQGLGAESLSKETIEKYAPAPISSELTNRIEKILDVRFPLAGAITQDGARLFFNWRVTGFNQIWRLDRPQAFPVQMTAGEDAGQLAGITPDGKWILVSRDHHGDENPGLYLQSADGGPLLVISHKPKIQTRLARVGGDSDSIYFLSNDLKPDSYAIYRYSIRTKKTETLFTEDGLWSLEDEKDGKFLLQMSTGSLTSEYFLWEPGSKPEPILGQGEKEEYSVQFGPSLGEYLVLTNKFGDFRRLYRFKSGKFSPLSEDVKMDIESFYVDYPRKNIYVQWNDRGYSKLEARDARTFTKIPFPTFPGAYHVEFGGRTRNGRFITFTVTYPNAPREGFSWERATGKLTRWTTPSVPEENLSRFSAVSLEHYPARDGTKIPMFVYRPKQCANTVCPVIVSFHGGPELQATPALSPFVQIFMDAGFIFVEPNIRGSDGYGKTWLSSDDGRKRLDVITDIEDVSKHIRFQWSRSGKVPKIGVFGGSYGGYATLYAMTRFAGAFDAGVSIVGISDLRTFLQNTAPYRRILRISEYGDPEKDQDALKALSPLTHLSKIKSPLLIIQGLTDPRVPVGEAIQIHEQALKNGVDSKLIVFPDEGHGIAKRPNQVLAWGHTLGFFMKNLQ